MADEIRRNIDTMGKDDMAIPEIKLVQNVGGEEAKGAKAKPGDLYCALTGDVYPAEKGLDIVIVDLTKQRTFWGRTDISDEPPECSSLDGVTSVMGNECKQCDHYTEAPWAIDVDKRRKFCNLHYNIIAINYETHLPVLIRTTGNSAKAIRELISSLRWNRELKGQLERAIIHMSSRTHKSAAGNSFASTFRLTGLIAEAEKVQEMKTLTLQLLGTEVALPNSQSERRSSSPRERLQV